MQEVLGTVPEVSSAVMNDIIVRDREESSIDVMSSLILTCFSKVEDTVRQTLRVPFFECLGRGSFLQYLTQHEPNVIREAFSRVVPTGSVANNDEMRQSPRDSSSTVDSEVLVPAITFEMEKFLDDSDENLISIFDKIEKALAAVFSVHRFDLLTAGASFNEVMTNLLILSICINSLSIYLYIYIYISTISIQFYIFLNISIYLYIYIYR